MAGFLPINAREMRALGWERPDFVYVLGDAYVDHPSFGHAIISRVLERAGYRVAMLPQPDWRDPSSVLEFGEPRLGFLVTGGNMDSMVNHYSVGRHRRRTDAYTPGGVTGKRPDYATVVYCNLIRRSFPKIPILIGGIEASLRRLAHYDYWSDSLKRSILLDSQADLLLYGMGERAIVEVADAMNSGLDIHDITFVNGTAYRTRDCSGVVDAITLPPYDELRADRRRYAESFAVQYRNTDPFSARCLIEPYGREFVVQNPPQPPLSTQEMDDVYALPYQDTYHPSYRKAGGVPAIAEVQFSLVSNRGCFGGCSFCALTGGVQTVLPQKEFLLLYKLVSSPGHIFTRQQLMDDIWGIDTHTDPRTVDVHINRLRDRFRENQDFEIITVRGIGYKAERKHEEG